MRRFAAPVLVAIAAGWTAAHGRAASQGLELLDTRPPEWSVAHWLGGPPLAFADLRGKVALVRWWTAPYCSFCRASAPALNDFHTRYAARGLVVVGLYHHKSPDLLDPDAVARWAVELGFEFPVGIDGDWATLRRWWLDPVPEADWTSVTFLLDREGRVRHIHPGGQYVAGDADYAALEAKIEELLAEPGPPVP
jgi:thiol-disulfide isomerase/thioredoxin